MSSLTVAVPLPPMPKKRPRVTRNGTFMPPAYVKWKADVGTLIKVAANRQQAQFTGRVAVSVDFSKDHMVVEVESIERERFGQADIDNLAGAVMDALQESGVIVNDRDVVELEARFVK